MNIGEAVKERILELCREQDISINKLSSMSGVTQSTVNNIVSGRNRSTTISTIKKLCDGLGITIEDFFHSELFRGLEKELKYLSWYNLDKKDRRVISRWDNPPALFISPDAFCVFSVAQNHILPSTTSASIPLELQPVAPHSPAHLDWRPRSVDSDYCQWRLAPDKPVAPPQWGAP